MLKERNEVDQLLVFDIALPWFQNNGVFGLSFDMLRFGIQYYRFGERSVEVREVLYVISFGPISMQFESLTLT